MNVLIVGSGGREHAFTWKASQSDLVEKIFVAPGNAGTSLEPKAENINISASDIDALVSFSVKEHIDTYRRHIDPNVIAVAAREAISRNMARTRDRLESNLRNDRSGVDA